MDTPFDCMRKIEKRTVENESGETISLIHGFPWRWYINESQSKSLVSEQSGKWMHFFSDASYAADICLKAVLQGAVVECKHTCEEASSLDHRGVICFYLNADDIEAHKRIIKFLIENNLIRKTKSGRLYNISFKYDSQSYSGEYAIRGNYKPKIRLSDFVDLDTACFKKKIELN